MMKILKGIGKGCAIALASVLALAIVIIGVLNDCLP
jgi:hypothetical protein